MSSSMGTSLVSNNSSESRGMPSSSRDSWNALFGQDMCLLFNISSNSSSCSPKLRPDGGVKLIRFSKSVLGNVSSMISSKKASVVKNIDENVLGHCYLMHDEPTTWIEMIAGN